MKCPKCGYECSDGVKFCSKCGTKLVSPQPLEDQTAPVQFIMPAKDQANPNTQQAWNMNVPPMSTVAPPSNNNVPQMNQPQGNPMAMNSPQMNHPQGNPMPMNSPQMNHPQGNPMAMNSPQMNHPQGNPMPMNSSQMNHPQGNPMPMNSSQMNQPPRKTSAASKKSPLKFVLIGAGSIALVLIVVFVMMKLKGGSSTFKTISKDYLEDSVINIDGEYKSIYFTYGGKVIETDEEDWTKTVYNFGNTAGAYLNDDQELYYVTADGVVKVADEVEAFKISDDGTGILYTADVDDEEGDLYLYNSKNKKSKQVESEVYYRDFCISPDGETVCFLKDYEDSSDFSSYVSINGKKAEVLGDEQLPIAVSNDATYLYYIDNSKLYVKHKDDVQKLSSNGEVGIGLNQSYSQVFFVDDGKSYISVNGGERQKIANGSISSVILINDVLQSFNDDIWVLGVDSLLNLLYRIDNETYYLDSKLNAFKINMDYPDYYQVSEDGKSIIYSSSGDLYKIKDVSVEDAKSVPIGMSIDIELFRASKDLSYLYYINDDDELMYLKVGGKPKKIADDIEVSYCYLDSYDSTLYFLSDVGNEFGTLYYSKNGSEKKKVKGADDVCLEMYAERCYYVLENDDDAFDLYLLTDGKAKRVIENMQNQQEEDY